MTSTSATQIGETNMRVSIGLLRVVLVAVLFLGLPERAAAAPITFTFTSNILYDPFGTGAATISGSFTFDSEATPIPVGSTVYRYPLDAFSVTIGSDTLIMDGGFIQVHAGSSLEIYEAGIPGSMRPGFDTLNGNLVGSMWISLSAPSPTMFGGSTALPLTPDFQSAATDGYFAAEASPDWETALEGDQPLLVPEPGTVALLSTGPLLRTSLGSRSRSSPRRWRG